MEDPATGLHRPRDYMQSLEARVAYLEGLLQQTRPDVAIDHLMGFRGEGPAAPTLENDVTTNATPNVASGSCDMLPEAHGLDDVPAPASVDAEDPADQLSAEVALLCINAAGGEPHYFGPSSAVSFSRIVSAAINLPRKVGRSTDGVEQLGWRSTRPLPISFPIPALASTLSKAYFDNIHPQYPFLHRPNLQFWEDTCLKANASGALNAAGDVPLFFCWMVSNRPILQ